MLEEPRSDERQYCGDENDCAENRSLEHSLATEMAIDAEFLGRSRHAF